MKQHSARPTRRLALQSGAALAAAGALAACTPGGSSGGEDAAGSGSPTASGGGSTSGSDDALTFWHYYGGGATAPIEALVARYTEETGVPVDIRFIPFGDFNRTLLQSATGGGLPDIALVNAFDTALFADSGMLVDLSSYVESWGEQDQYFSGPWATTQFQEATYGIPHVADAYSLWLNNGLLGESGATAPTTWDEAEATAAATTAEGRYGLAYCGITGVEGATAWILRFLAAGGDITQLDGDAGTAAMESFQRMIDDGSVSQGVLSWNEDDVYTQFRTGAAAMMINSASYVSTLTEEAPELDLQIVPMPSDQTTSSWLSAENLTITSDSADPERAWEMVAWLQQPEVMNEYLPDRNKLPVRTDTAEDAQWQEPLKKVFVDQLEVAWAPDETVAPASAEIFTAVQLALQSVLSGSQDIPTALTELQGATDEALGA